MSRPKKRQRQQEPAAPVRARPLPTDVNASLAQWLSPREAHVYALTSKDAATDLRRSNPLLCETWTKRGAKCYQDPDVSRYCSQYCGAACRRFVERLLNLVVELHTANNGAGSQVRFLFPTTSHEHTVPWRFGYTHNIQSYPPRQKDDLDYFFANRYHWEIGGHFTVPGFVSGPKAIGPIADKVCWARERGRRYQLQLRLELDASVPEENAVKVALYEELLGEPFLLDRSQHVTGRRVPIVWADPWLSAFNALQWTLELHEGGPLPLFNLTGVSN